MRTTDLAVLGVLAVEPSSGYGIRESIATTIGYFWSESFGQIHPTLADLEERGLVGRLRTEGRKVVYEATPAGLEHLARLLAQDFTQPPSVTRPCCACSSAASWAARGAARSWSGPA